MPTLIAAEHSSPAAPFSTPPEYSMKQIHDAIPPHCFKSNTLVSLGYVLRDCCFVFALMLGATQISYIENYHLKLFAWMTYAFCQGLVFTGLWEIAHECGHGALSKHRWVNNAIGLVVHSFLLVPYHSWKFTHSHHHKSTNNIEGDIAFVPNIKEDYIAEKATHCKAWALVEDMPIVCLTVLFVHQLVAFPLYLTINNLAIPRMKAANWWTRSHFYFGGDGPNFKPANRNDIIISDLGIAVALTILWRCAAYFGIWNVALFYIFPYLWTNHWILTITFLQHTDASIPYYDHKTWTFLRGAASTVDRDFGFIGTTIFHGAIETHVLHHHASRIPFYHATEASKAIRGVMGTHYQADFKTPYLWAFWRNYNDCRFVEEKDRGSRVYFFNKVE
ncbi:hypothetical protein B7463_g8801, partial [Scytalidium lignicola]